MIFVLIVTFCHVAFHCWLIIAFCHQLLSVYMLPVTCWFFASYLMLYCVFLVACSLKSKTYTAKWQLAVKLPSLPVDCYFLEILLICSCGHCHYCLCFLLHYRVIVAFLPPMDCYIFSNGSSLFFVANWLIFYSASWLLLYASGLLLLFCHQLIVAFLCFLVVSLLKAWTDTA